MNYLNLFFFFIRRKLPFSIAAFALILFTACSHDSLSNSEARKTIEEQWNSSHELGFVIGNIEFIGTIHFAPDERPDPAQGEDLVRWLPSYHLAAQKGLLTISNEWTPRVGYSGGSATITLTDAGRAAGKVVQVGKFEKLWIHVSTIKIDEIVTNVPIPFDADQYRVVIGTYTYDLPEDWKKMFAEVYGYIWDRERRFKLLLKYDPITKKWLIQAGDVANRAEQFNTTHVDNIISKFKH